MSDESKKPTETDAAPTGDPFKYVLLYVLLPLAAVIGLYVATS